MIQVMQIIVFDIGLGEYDHHQRDTKIRLMGTRIIIEMEVKINEGLF